LEEPRLVVPFYNELNTAAKELRKFLENMGWKTALKKISKQHLRDLALKLKENLLYKASVTGVEEVLEYSVEIHDLFRLATEEFVPDEITNLLPNNWRDKIDSYMTVYCAFPELDSSLGLVKLSIIDTPGGNEDGVQRLKIQNTINDSVSVSNFATLVSTHFDYTFDSLEPMRFLFCEAKSRYQVPTMLLLNHGEEVQASAHANLRINASATLTHMDGDVTHRLFEEQDVYIVSAKRKMVEMRMKRYLLHHKKKPHPTKSLDKYAREVAFDWINAVGFGQDYDDKLANYETTDEATLLKRCDKVVESSGMQQPIDRMFEVTVRKAIPLNVKTSVQRSKDIAEKLIAKLDVEDQDLDKDELMKAEEEAKAMMQKLTQAKESLEHNLVTVGENQKKRLNEVLDKIKRDFQHAMDTNLPSQGSHANFLGLVVFHVTRIINKKAEINPEVQMVYDLLRAKKLPELTPDQLTEGYIDICHGIRIAVTEFVSMEVKGFPLELNKWVAEKRQELEASVESVVKSLESAFKLESVTRITPPLELQEPKDERNQLKVHGFDHDFIERFRPSSKSIFGQLKEFLDSRAEDVRHLNMQNLKRDLVAHVDKVAKDIKEELEPQFERMVKDLSTKFGQEAIRGLNTLINMANAKLSQTAEKKKEAEVPRRRLATELRESLPKLEQFN